ncbi:hypothetical protein PGT21_012069 [Puccinia graminis f. sp. tritici]|uniref:Ubiquitin carboxyl-terminal hydrolase 7 ICP0-binding domain-containing protein n=1 Tax=Puccinia graminis f. sp. tritici TaxID=56615 RepID=A0A5B0Q5N0_PUCGR|nr:hypothetical protein PGT21_012069 [Puccinia graminis f. sp. tritici]
MDKSNSHFMIQIITEETFREHNGLDLTSLDDRTTVPPSELPRFRVAKRSRFLNFKFLVSRTLGYQPNKIRLWPLRERAEFALRPHSPVPEDDRALKMQTVYDRMTHKGPYIVFYLEVVGLAHEVQVVPTSEDKPRQMIFLKYFDPSTQKLAGIGHFYLPPMGMNTSSVLITLIKARMGFSDGTGVKLYEVCPLGSIEFS